MTKQGSLSDSSRVVDAVLEIRYRRIKVLPPIGKQSRYRAHSLTVVHARECNPPANWKSIDWKLITDSPICNLGLISRPKDMDNRKLGSSLTDNIVNVVEFRNIFRKRVHFYSIPSLRSLAIDQRGFSFSFFCAKKFSVH